MARKVSDVTIVTKAVSKKTAEGADADKWLADIRTAAAEHRRQADVLDNVAKPLAGGPEGEGRVFHGTKGDNPEDRLPARQVVILKETIAASGSIRIVG